MRRGLNLQGNAESGWRPRTGRQLAGKSERLDLRRSGAIRPTQGIYPDPIAISKLRRSPRMAPVAYQRADSFHRCDSLAGLAGLIDGPDLLVDSLDLFFPEITPR